MGQNHGQRAAGTIAGGAAVKPDLDYRLTLLHESISITWRILLAKLRISPLTVDEWATLKARRETIQNRIKALREQS